MSRPCDCCGSDIGNIHCPLCYDNAQPEPENNTGGWLVVIVLVIFMLVILFFNAAARASDEHVPSDPGHWYDSECCDLRDCRPAEPGQVVETNIGFKVTVQMITSSGEERAYTEEIAYDDPRIMKSQDREIHVCHYNTTAKILCVYIPKIMAF